MTETDLQVSTVSTRSHDNWRKHFPLPPLPYRHFWDRHLCYVFSLTSVGRLFRPTFAENDNLIIMDIVIN